VSTQGVSRAVRRCAAALALAAAAGSAAAHSPIPGIGNFYSGAAHPFISPAHLIALLALGLVVGQRGQRAGGFGPLRVPLIVLTATLVLGAVLAAGAWFGDPDTDRALLLLAALGALAVVAAWPAPLALVLLLAAAVALAVMLASAPSGVDASALRTSLVGTAVASLVVVAYAAVMVAAAQRAWLAVAVRVAGSWIAAAALLVLALSFAPVRGG
jgi:urease accessory protein